MYYMGIDLGGTNIAAGIVDEKLNLIKKESCPTMAEREPDEIMKDMSSLCQSLIDNCGIKNDEIACVGIATPGAVVPDKGIVSYSPNLPMINYPISDKLKSFFPTKKVLVENDANAAALGEALAGAGKGADYSVMITLGTGVGGGIVIDGKLYTGFNYAGGELGHMVIEYNGRPCPCGRKGCFEQYASANALAMLTREKLEETKDTAMWDDIGHNMTNVTAITAFKAMKQGDRVAKEVTDKYISYLACGIANLINIFQPNILIIGGGVCKEGDYLLEPLKEIVSREQYTSRNSVNTEIKVAMLGNDAGIIGAAALDI